MKLAKKMLVCLMAISMVAVFAISAFAAGPSVSMTAPTGKVGETVNVTVTGSGLAGLESTNLFVRFDPDKAELVSATGANVGMGMVAVPEGGDIAGANSSGTAGLAIIMMSAMTSDSAELATFTFKIKADDAAVTLDCESFAVNGESLSVDSIVATGSLELVDAEVPETTTEAPVTTTEPPETTTEAPVTTTEAPDTTIPQPTTERPTEVIPSVVDDEIIPVIPRDLEPTKATKPPVDPAKADKPPKAAKVAKVAQTGDTAVAVIAGIMAIGAVGFIATKKKEEI